MCGRTCRLLLITFFMVLAIPPKAHSQLIIIEAIKAVAKKVVRAMDLQVQRMQNHTIDLQNVQKKIENTLSKLKLDEIAHWTDEQKELYRQYFDELWKVKAILSYGKQLQDIIKKQRQLFMEYQDAYSIVTQDPHFSKEELDYILGVYNGILDASSSDIDDLLTIIQSFTLQMADADRQKMISEVASRMDEHLTTLRQFNQRNKLLSRQRAKSIQEIDRIKQLYK